MSDARINLYELKQIARLSRRGSRRAVYTPEGWNVMAGGQFIADCRDLSSTAALIALTDPATILALLDRLDALEDALKQISHIGRTATALDQLEECVTIADATLDSFSSESPLDKGFRR